ncbi:unnamed protein product [Arctogadus glacialis]
MRRRCDEDCGGAMVGKRLARGRRGASEQDPLWAEGQLGPPQMAPMRRHVAALSLAPQQALHLPGYGRKDNSDTWVGSPHTVRQFDSIPAQLPRAKPLVGARVRRELLSHGGCGGAHWERLCPAGSRRLGPQASLWAETT